MYQDKLRGFVGLRASLVVKVQVNSQPFQQGRLLLQYIPYAQYMPNRVLSINASLQGRTGCPRTDLDLSVGTECELRIPYVSPHAYYNLITGQGSFGSIYLTIYSPLLSNATSTVEYTVWAHLEDIDVQFPTGAPIFTGNSPNRFNIAQRIIDGDITGEELQRVVDKKNFKNSSDRIFAQMDNELTILANNHTPSQMMGQASSVFTSMSKLPLLGNIFTKPAWISRSISNVLHMAGFSKPTVSGLPCESKLRTQARMANYDGADTSHKLALSSENELETIPGLAGTDKDEMAISTIVSIPNYWDSFEWSNSDAAAKVLWTNYVTPMKIKPVSDTIKDRFLTTHMGYIANSFAYWRGGIVYTFKFVKTHFHSGRLLISHIPFYFGDGTQTAPDISRAQKMVVDLRTATEVTFTVPYVSTRPWMHCIRPESEFITGKLFNCVTGQIRIEVLNALVNPDTVANKIKVIVEVSGASDLSFAAPSATAYAPYLGKLSSSEGKVRAQEKKVEFTNETIEEGEETIRVTRSLPERVPAPYGSIFVQMMGEDVVIQRNDAQKGADPNIFGAGTKVDSLSPDALCIGEKVVSVRQLIKRFGRVLAPTTINNKCSMLLAPFANSALSDATPAVNFNSHLEYFSLLFGFWRGGVRYKIIPYNDTETSSDCFGQYTIDTYNSLRDDVQFLASKFSESNPTILTNGYYSEGGQSKVIIRTNIEGAAEVEYPYYNSSHISPVTISNPPEPPFRINEALKGSYPPMLSTIRYKNQQNATTSHEFHKAAADDFSFLYILGVPLLTNRLRSVN